jgi:hypothetical protein
MGNVGERVGELRVREGTARPVGEAGGLVDLGLGEIVGQLFVGHRIPIAADHGGDLGVEEGLRDNAAEIPDDLQVLPGGMEDLDHVPVSHERHERVEAQALGQGVDEAGIGRIRTRHLDQTELGVIGGLAQEFRIDRDERMLAEAAADGRQGVGGGDQVHKAFITHPRKARESAIHTTHRSLT